MASVKHRDADGQQKQDQAGQACFRAKGPPGPKGRTGHFQLEKGGKGKPADPETKKILEKVPTEMEGDREIKGAGEESAEGEKDARNQNAEQAEEIEVGIV